MPVVPKPVRIAKHALFQFFPGRIGLRNRACFHHLTKPSASDDFDSALASLSPDDICIDCGANVGVVSGKFASKGAQTYSFEPDPWSFKNLEKNLGGHSNVKLFNKAVGTKNGKTTFFRDHAFEAQPDLHSLASSLLPRADRSQEEVEVEVIDIIDFIKSLGRKVKILKMDIEGAEVPILERLIDENLAADIGYIFVETHELQFPELLEKTAAIRKHVSTAGLRNINLDWH